MMKLERQAGALRQRERMSHARLLLLLSVISDRIAAEAQLTEEESIEFSSDITIILSLVYKHTFRMLREYHSFESPTTEHRASVSGEQTLEEVFEMAPFDKAAVKLHWADSYLDRHFFCSISI